SPHIDHLHVEINEAAAFEDLPWYSDPVGPGEEDAEPCPVLPADGGIVDDGPCTKLLGNPQYWRHEAAGHDGALVWTNAFVSNSPGNSARITVNVPTPDLYRVEVWLDPAYARFASTRYRVGDNVVVVDQGARAPTGGGFVALGDFDLGESTAIVVEDNVAAIDADEPRSIMVDAVRVTRIDEASEEPVTPVDPVDPVTPVDPVEPEPGAPDDDKPNDDDDGPILDDDDPGTASDPIYVNVSKKGCSAGGDVAPLALALGMLWRRRRSHR
ncbi:MAG TPA: hypothetical protein VGF99_14885, partial [Myxococcota bacterium]